MGSPQPPESDGEPPHHLGATARAWYVFSDALPDGEILMPILTEHGTALAVRPGEMTEALMTELNAVLRHLIGVGLWQPGQEGAPPEREE
ncbi:hypothetical protein GCM10023335_76000 [Streptomyces siamensis]|uniref:Uncharacterized protein n=1 Tax=Streptomyces siamensis TaxID=1274986 RepID=A0ABP9JLN4_9ACTN